jgi:hypothetical protein
MSDPVLTPNFEPVEMTGAVSGSDVIQDLLDRVGERLSLCNDLRPTDSYSAYAARVTVEIQLTDVAPVEVTAHVAVGSIDPRQPSQQITLNVPTVEAAGIMERSGLQPASLERFADDDAARAAAEETAAPKRKRFYVASGRPRGRPRKGLS